MTIMKLARESQIRIEERAFTVEEAKQAGEAFVTSASSFLIPVTGMDSRDFAIQLLEEKKVAVAPGNTFGKMCSDHVRISIAATEEDVREALQRICAMIRENSRKP